MKQNVQSGIIQMCGNGFYIMSVKVIAMCTIITYVLSGHELTPQKVFKLIAWLEVLRYSLFYGLNKSVVYLSQAYFSCQRIEVGGGWQPRKTMIRHMHYLCI